MGERNRWRKMSAITVMATGQEINSDAICKNNSVGSAPRQTINGILTQKTPNAITSNIKGQRLSRRFILGFLVAFNVGRVNVFRSSASEYAFYGMNQNPLEERRFSNHSIVGCVIVFPESSEFILMGLSTVNSIGNSPSVVHKLPPKFQTIIDTSAP